MNRPDTWLGDDIGAAPTGPGVYLFVGGEGEVLYVGKAKNIRRRLSSHRGSERAIERIRGVRWEETASELEALAREADLIAALTPALNRSHTRDATWAYVVVGGAQPAAFELLQQPRGGSASYGCFPFLGKGPSHHASSKLNAGYTALLRLLWAAGPRSVHIPRRIAGASPPGYHEAYLDADVRRPLHDFMSGTSRRLLKRLREPTARCPPYMQPALARDVERAELFFILGTRRQRELRLRHRLPPGPVDRLTMTRLIGEEVARLV